MFKKTGISKLAEYLLKLVVGVVLRNEIKKFMKKIHVVKTT